jgi:iron complex outermembrane receptor protein
VGSSKSASKTDTPLQDIPQAVSVVTRQQIEDQQARTISEALNYTPGCLPAQ